MDQLKNGNGSPKNQKIQTFRPLIAFFDYHDVFEDFYSHYGVDQQSFASRWADTGNHAWLSLLQREIGNVVWYVFSIKPEFSESRHEIVGCHIKMRPSSWVHRCLWKAFYLPRASWRWRFAYRAYATVASYVALISFPFLRTLNHERPDYLFTQDYSTGRFDILFLLSRFFGIPLVTYHSGSWPDMYLGRRIKRWTIPRADWIFPSGQSELDNLVNKFGVKKERLEILRPPIDTSVFHPMDRSEACRVTGLDDRRRYILFIGRFEDRVKRLSALIRAFSAVTVKHPSVDLLVVGDGPDRRKLHDLAEETAPGRIQFLGWISKTEKKTAIYNASDFLVLPSRSEGFPLVIGEAFACGTPVLATAVGAISDLVINGQTGWLIEPENDDALADRLSMLLTNPDLIESMRPQARIMAEKHVSPDAVAEVLKKGFLWAGRRP